MLMAGWVVERPDPTQPDPRDTRGRSVSYRHLLAMPELAALLAATCLSRLASRTFVLVSVLFALTRFHSPPVAGWIAFAVLGPGLLVSPLAGAVLDRIGPARVFFVDMAASAVLVCTLAFVSGVGRASVPVVIGLVAMISVTGPLGWAAVWTLLPRLVAAEALGRANALDVAIFATVDVIGPALAGLLIGVVGPTAAFVVVALFHAAAAMAIGRLPPQPPQSRNQASLLRRAGEGIAAVARAPTLRGLAVSYAIYQLAWGILVVAVPVMAIRRFDPGAAEVVTGLAWALVGVAGGFSALLAGHLRVVGRELWVIVTGMMVVALTVGAMAAASGLFGLVVGLLLFGAAVGPIDVALLTLRQRRTPSAQFARVISVSMSLNLAGLPIGSALAGMTISWSMPATLLMAAGAALLAAAAAAGMLRSAG